MISPTGRRVGDILFKAMKAVLPAIFFCLLLPLAAGAQQSGTMRCRNGIVSLEDTIPDVLKKCGPPAFQDRREQMRSFGRHNRSLETVTVDVWTYNFGPQEFMYEVTFHNGRVARIESLDEGY